jgi:type I restriction enzyme, S subunit
VSVATVLLSEVARVFNGKTPTKSDQRNEGHPVLKVRDVDEQGVFRGPFGSFVEPGYVSKYAQKLVQAGDSMVLNAAHNADYVASKSFFASVEAIGSLATGEWLMIRPDGVHLHAGFARHWVTSPGTRFKMKELVKGIHLYPKDVARLTIPLPPIEEQRRIAAILDAADALRAKRRQALAKLDTLAQSIFIDMFGGDWDRWPFVSVETVAADRKGSIRTGPFGSQLLHDEFVDEGIAVLGIDNAVTNEFKWGKKRFITSEKYEELRRFTVFPGDVLVTIMGTCGRVAIVPPEIPTSINTKHLCCVTVDAERCGPDWLWASLLFHPRVLDQLGATYGAVMPGLNMGTVKGAEIPLPPRSVQEEFAARRLSVSEYTAHVTESAGLADALFASLQQRAFRGEL